MKKQSKVLSVVLTVALAISMTSVCFAEAKTFTKVNVDSNSYSYIVRYTKTQRSETATVNITDIYKANGDPSNYRRVNAKATSTGTPENIEKGSDYELDIPSSYQGKGSMVTLYCMGNDPALDCKISGRFNAY